MLMDPIILSRIQFALTLSFHIIFPSITIGLAAFLTYWEVRWLQTRQNHYYQLCRFWTKIFALAFGMGVVSGIVLSYEFGTNFSVFSAKAGNILGPLLSYEVLTAFFLEAGFLGIMLFGWNRVSPGIHFASTLLVTIGTFISAFWILSANSWMHTPAGYVIKEGIFYPESWMAAIFNPSFPYRYLHMVMASLLSATFLIAGISAWYLLKRRHLVLARSTFSVTLMTALFLAPAQLIIGDFHGLNTLKYQPIKLAALEGRWEAERGAPLTLFAIPDTQAERNRFAVEVPKLGSLILTHEMDGLVPGLKSVPKEDRPYVPLSFYSFRLMVGIGLFFIVLALIALYLRVKGRLFDTVWFHKLCVFAAPLGFVAVLAGWFVTETGRQPWLIQGLMRTREGATLLPAPSVLATVSIFAVLYSALLVIFIYYLLREVQKGPAETVAAIDKKEIEHAHERLTPWLDEE